MAYGYPDGCTQSDHDRYFGDERSNDGPDDDTIYADCGHWCSERCAEVIGDKLICPKCSYNKPADPMALAVLAETMGVTRGN